MKVSTEVLIARLKEVTPEGFEVSIRFGMSSVTRAVYLRKDLFYIFDMEDDFIFRKNEGYSEAEFAQEYVKYFWEIEMTISYFEIGFFYS